MGFISAAGTRSLNLRLVYLGNPSGYRQILDRVRPPGRNAPGLVWCRSLPKLGGHIGVMIAQPKAVWAGLGRRRICSLYQRMIYAHPLFDKSIKADSDHLRIPVRNPQVALQKPGVPINQASHPGYPDIFQHGLLLCQLGPREIAPQLIQNGDIAGSHIVQALG